ncbi:lipopolysaccharide/colanic/teichoic acid biosynthesis glycosyltransferase [Streptomyces sp. 846.5]|nr:sugar transferase [Streptomyces sp. 846.5]TDT94101.1 lipopolysaccharide/colanic/teichoic acid biosynthesis glycosyltransferase [Streptomyces sp. 846.5]
MADPWTIVHEPARNSPAGDTVRADTTLRRAVDLVVAALLLPTLLPLLVLLALAVRCTCRGPAIYRQRRVGRYGQPFSIWKFRTMVVDADRIGAAVGGTGDPRITTVGRLLRLTRLDELPQLVNLLRGEMTLIGPRPEVERFLRYYTPREREMLRVRPGILGPGALLFAAEQSAELDSAPDPDAYYAARLLHPKLALDRAYLADRRLGTDLRLLARAAGVVLGRPAGRPGDQ